MSKTINLCSEHGEAITLSQLKALLDIVPLVDPDSGDPYELWIDSRDGTSRSASAVVRLNKGDLIVE